MLYHILRGEIVSAGPDTEMQPPYRELHREQGAIVYDVPNSDVGEIYVLFPESDLDTSERCEIALAEAALFGSVREDAPDLFWSLPVAD